jgi:hypothetical protein
MALRGLVRVSVACAVAAALLAGVAPVGAATGDVVVVRGFFVMNQVPGAFDTELTGCDSPGPEPHGIPNTMVNTSTGSPLGEAFWAVDGKQQDVADGPSRGYDVVSDFTSVSLDVLNQNPPGDGGAEGARVYAFVGAGDGTVWSGLADAGQVAAGSGWQTVSGDASTVFEWLHYPRASLDNQPISDVPFMGTIAQLQAEEETGDNGGRVGISMGCGGGAYGFDGATFGLGDTSTTFDLETTGTSVVDGGPASFLMPGGETDEVQCALYDGDDYTWYEEGDLTLQSRAAGTHTWRNVDTGRQQITAGVNGLPDRVSFTVSPNLNTAYRCAYAGTYPSTSRPEPILVYDRIWARARNERVPRGHTIVIHGHVLPAAPGRRVSLYLEGRVVAHTRLDATGHYRLHTPARHLGQEQLAVATATTRKHVGSLTPVVIQVVRPQRQSIR